VPIAEVNGVQLYYEDTGEGFPLIWNHEFAGDCHSLEQQVRHLSRRYRVITYNYRGWPPSSVPGDISAYSTEILVEDLAALLRHLDISRAHIGGLSMGGNVALGFAATHPAAAASVIVVGSGSGTISREAFVKESERLALVFEQQGAAVAGQQIAMRPGRRVYAEKDPRGYSEFVERLQQHSAQGAALMIRGVLLSRKTIFEMEEMLGSISVPALVIVGDRDEGAVGPSVFMQRTLPYASLVVLPFTGHIPNLEEPALFNLHVGEFLASVGAGRWADWRQPHGPA